MQQNTGSSMKKQETESNTDPSRFICDFLGEVPGIPKIVRKVQACFT